MACKEYTQYLSFADLELRRVLGQSRTQKFLEALEKTKDWKPVEAIVLESFWMKEHPAVDAKSGRMLSSLIFKASQNDSPYFPVVVGKGIHGSKLPDIVMLTRGYPGEPNRVFLSMNGIRDGIMRKGEVHAKLTATEIKRNKKIAKLRATSSSST